MKIKYIHKLDKILNRTKSNIFLLTNNLNCYNSSLIYSFKNEIHSSCFNLREKINYFLLESTASAFSLSEFTRGVKKKHYFLPAHQVRQSALRERQCSLSLAYSFLSWTTDKHCVTGTVRHTALYKRFLYNFHKLEDGY